MKMKSRLDLGESKTYVALEPVEVVEALIAPALVREKVVH